MDKTFRVPPDGGEARVPPSKSLFHRHLFISAFCGGGSRFFYDAGQLPDDVAADVSALRSIGFPVSEREGFIEVGARGSACSKVAARVVESAATLNFLIALVASLGLGADVSVGARLSERVSPEFLSLLAAHGVSVRRNGTTLHLDGKLRPGVYRVRTDVSSQPVSALLMALPFLDGESVIEFDGRRVSWGYVGMTLSALAGHSVSVGRIRDGFLIRPYGGGRGVSPDCLTIPGDFSSAVPFACAGALSDGFVEVSGIGALTGHPDEVVLGILNDVGAVVRRTDRGFAIRRGSLRPFFADASVCPDSVPSLAVLAMFLDGVSTICRCERLRFKESDRVAATLDLVEKAGGTARYADGRLEIRGTSGIHGCRVNSFSDHRIAMAAAVLAVGTGDEVTVEGSECVSKSFPGFFGQPLFSVRSH